jgi:4-amino-4-deoxychorismate lyase
VLAVAISGRGLVDPHEPVLLADDQALTRGRAVFETLRVYRGRPFRLEQHLARLARSAELLGLPPPDLPELENLAWLAVEDALLADTVLRLYWTPGAEGDERSLGLATVSELPAWLETARERGVRLVSLYWPRRVARWLLPGVKSTSYAGNMAAEEEAKRRGADDAVFVDDEWVVLEGPVTNIWWRYGRVLHTPAVELGILAGETRAALRELAPSLGFTVQEGAYLFEHLLGADEVFTSSSVREVMPVVEVDDHLFHRGVAAERLQTALRELAGAIHDQVGR